MYEFSASFSAPVPIKIEGVEHRLPRFLRADFKDYITDRQKPELDRLTAGMSPKERAQFIALTPPLPLDIATVHRELVSVDGAPYVVRKCMTKAGIPKDKIDLVIDGGDMLVLRNLADELASAVRVAEEIEGDATDPKDAGETNDPKSVSDAPTTGASESSPGTGSGTTPGSPPPTPPETPTP